MSVRVTGARGRAATQLRLHAFAVASLLVSALGLGFLTGLPETRPLLAVALGLLGFVAALAQWHLSRASELEFLTAVALSAGVIVVAAAALVALALGACDVCG